MSANGAEEFAEFFGARRDSVRRSALLRCGDVHRADGSGALTTTLAAR